MKRFMTLLAASVLFAGCATLSSTRPSGQVITQSFGSTDFTKYKTFTVASSSEVGTPEFLRDVPILNNVIFRLEQEGLKFSKNPDNAEMIIVVNLVDAVGQRYVPPRTYTHVSYNPGTTQTNTTGNFYSTGNSVRFNAMSQSTSDASISTTTTTRGGYYVPVYGVGIALNAYDIKTKNLIWSGFGAREAEIKNVDPYINDIVLSIIDKHLITPAYISGKRYEIREAYLKRSKNEYLMGKDKDGEDHVSIINKINDDKTSIMTNLVLVRGLGGEMINFNIVINNQADSDIVIDPEKIKITLNDEEIPLVTKSRIMELAHKLKKDKKIKNIQGEGLIGMLIAGAHNAITESSISSQNQELDENIKMVFNNYIDKATIKAGEFYNSFGYIGGFPYMPDDAIIKIIIPIEGQIIEADYQYVPNWVTYEEYQKILAKSMN